MLVAVVSMLLAVAGPEAPVEGVRDGAVLARPGGDVAHHRTAYVAEPAWGTAGTRGCRRPSRPVVVELDRFPRIVDHVRDAVRPGVHRGDDVPGRYPRILHIERGKRAEKDRRWRRMFGDQFPPRPDEDRDEYPPSLSAENDDTRDSPHLRYVEDSENQAAGSSLGRQLRGYCNGVAFRIRLR